jgi:hypothetical protein
MGIDNSNYVFGGYDEEIIRPEDVDLSDTGMGCGDI